MRAMTRRDPSLPFILVTVFMSVLGIGLIIPVLPELITQLSGGAYSDGARIYGIFVASYAAMQFLFAPILGALSDRYGRRPVLLLSVFGAAIDYLVMALAPSLWLLFVARMLAGVTGANITVANAYIADITAPAERAKRFGLVGAAFGLGFIIAPAAGGFLGGIDLRAPFFAAAAVALANTLYGAFILPESLPQGNRKAFSWQRANPIGSIRALANTRGIESLTAVISIVTLGQALLQAVWVLFTAHRFGWGPIENGLALTVLGVITTAMQGGGIRPILRRLGEKRAAVLGLSASAVAFAGYALVPEGWMMFVVMLVGGVGGVAGPALQGWISSSVANNEQGSVQGAIASLGSLSAIVGPIVGTALFAFFTGPNTPLEFGGAPFAAGALLVLVSVVLLQRTPNPNAGTPGVT